MKKFTIRIYACVLAATMTSSTLIKLPYRSEANIKLVTEEIENDDSIYFKRGFDTEANIDDVILTIDEKTDANLTNAKRWINYLKKTDGIDDTWVKLLDVEQHLNAYTKPPVTKRILNHQNRNYYDEQTDSILWDKLAQRIRFNGIILTIRNHVKKILIRDKYQGIEAMNLDDINLILNQLEQFVNQTKELYPQYDLAHLACSLSKIAFTYHNHDDGKNMGIVAATSLEDIGWFINQNGQYPDLEAMLPISLHEYKHYLCSACIDEYPSEYFPVFAGIYHEDNNTLVFDSGRICVPVKWKRYFS